MTYARCEFTVHAATTSRERAAEIVDVMADAGCEIPEFLAGGGGFTWHIDDCDKPDCRGCGVPREETA